MSRLRPSATFTTEFGHEFEAERERILRRRFLWYAGVNTAVGVLSLVSGMIGLFRLPVGAAVGAVAISLLSSLFLTSIYVGSFLHVRKSPRPRIPLMRLTYWIIVVTGVTALLVGVVTVELARGREINVSGPPGATLTVHDGDTPPSQDVGPTAPKEPAAETDDEGPKGLSRESRALAVAVSGTFQIFVAHFFACLFLPWTPRESARPMAPLLALNALIMLVYMVLSGAWLIGTLTIILSPLIALPGAGVCWWRHSRLREGFQTKLVYRRYGEMRQELFNARQIHESLFPKPCLEGLARFSYRYEPMRQIGGDYLYASHWRRDGAEPVLSLVIIDVTGHGIPAALTVNRLHGEMERIFAEEPSTSPGEVLRLLNRYVHLTLATHSVYVTAVCLRVDPNSGTLEYASGGHPPAFVRAVDGRIEELGSTAFVLGVCAANDFHSAPQSLPFGPGDVLIVYTDGAIEARDSNGRMYGIAGLRRLISQGRPDAQGGWPAAILGEVDAFRHGPATDDTLVIEVVRPLDSALAQASLAGRGPRAAAASS